MAELERVEVDERMSAADRDLVPADRSNDHIEPLGPTIRLGLLALVICLHVGCGWALTRIRSVTITGGDDRSEGIAAA